MLPVGWRASAVRGKEAGYFHDHGFLQLHWTCTVAISGTCADTKQKGNLHRQLWQGTTLHKFTFPVRATKTLAVAVEYLCGCVYGHNRNSEKTKSYLHTGYRSVLASVAKVSPMELQLTFFTSNIVAVSLSCGYIFASQLFAYCCDIVMLWYHARISTRLPPLHFCFSSGWGSAWECG